MALSVRYKKPKISEVVEECGLELLNVIGGVIFGLWFGVHIMKLVNNYLSNLKNTFATA